MSVLNKMEFECLHLMKAKAVQENESSDMNGKINKILRIVTDIDRRLKNPTDQRPPLPQICDPNNIPDYSPPPPPPLPPNHPFTAKMLGSNASTIPPKLPSRPANYANIPPPRPPKSAAMIEPVVNNDGSIIFTLSQCMGLVKELDEVRKFIDENFEDEYVDKDINMACLDSVLRTLSSSINVCGQR